MGYNTISTNTGHTFQTIEKGFTIVNTPSLYLRYEKSNYSSYGVWIFKQKGINHQVGRVSGMENLPIEILTFALGKKASRTIQACCAARKWENPITELRRYQDKKQAQQIEHFEDQQKMQNYEQLKSALKEKVYQMVNKPTPSKFEELLATHKKYEASAHRVGFTYDLRDSLKGHNYNLMVVEHFALRPAIQAAIEQLRSDRIMLTNFVRTPWFKEFGQFTPVDYCKGNAALEYEVDFGYNYQGSRCEVTVKSRPDRFQEIFGFENSYTNRRENPDLYPAADVAIVKIFNYYEKQLTDRLQAINQLEFV